MKKLLLFCTGEKMSVGSPGDTLWSGQHDSRVLSSAAGLSSASSASPVLRCWLGTRGHNPAQTRDSSWWDCSLPPELWSRSSDRPCAAHSGLGLEITKKMLHTAVFLQSWNSIMATAVNLIKSLRFSP